MSNMSILNNVKWVGLGQAVKIFSQLIAIFYLTRLIAPAEYGLLAMASVVINLANIFNDLGTASAVIQRQNPSQEFYNAIYRINIITGFVVMVLVLAITPLMVMYFDQKALYGILILLSISFPVSSLSVVHKAILEKDLNFKMVIKIEVISALVALVVAIILAKIGCGVYSLVAQTLIAIAMTTVILMRVSEAKLLFTFKNDYPYGKDIIGFSGHVLGFNLINYFSRNLDSLLIGRFFSAAVLGSYSIAYRIMLFPLQSLTFVISRVFFPHFSKNLKNIDQNRADYLKSLMVILSLSAPMMLGLAAVSVDFTAIFFEKKWSLIGDLLLWLAPTAIIQSVLSTTGTVFIAYAKTYWLFILGCVGALLMAIAFVSGVFFEIKLLVIFYFIANVINFFPVMYLVGKILKFNMWLLFQIFVKYTLPALLMFISIKVSHTALDIIDLNIRFTIDVLIGVLSYAVFYCVINWQQVQGLCLFLKKRFLQ
jgi:O-antigen/teichoic acid export membrane protein